MNRKTRITAAELTKLAKIAKAQGVTVEAEIDGVIIRMKPFDPETSAIRLPENFYL